MITITDLEFVVALAKSSSLAAVARELRISPPAVSQRLRALETKLSSRLVERTGRVGLLLTSDGELLAEKAINILAEIEALSHELAERQHKIVGRLRIIAPFAFGRLYIAPAIKSFCDSHPDVSIDLNLSDNLLRLPDSNWDIIIQVAPLPDSSLIAIPLANNQRLVCAAPKYIEVWGAPKKPLDLADHRCIVLKSKEEDDSMWSFSLGSGNNQEHINIRVPSTLSSNDEACIHHWTLSGAGISIQSEWAVARDLKSGKLVRVLENFQLAPAPVIALVSHRNNRSTRVQMFLDHLKAIFTKPSWCVSS